MRKYLPELIAVPLLPFLLAQGKYTRRVTPRLPEAPGPVDGVAGTPGRTQESEPISLLALGESPVAGVGVKSHEEAITGQLAKALAGKTGRPVSWRATGKNGITVRDAVDQLIPLIPRRHIDVALVAFGVNDTTSFRPVSRWRRDLIDLLAAVESRCSPAVLVLSGVPPLAHFPALPQPLRWVMGLKANALDRELQSVAKARAHAFHVPLLLDTRDREIMASDGYHPSAKGCTAWAALLAEAIALTLLDKAEKTKGGT